MTDDTSMNLYNWIRLLNSAMWLFQCQPTEQHKNELLATVKDYQQATAHGLPICRAVPPPLDPADSLGDYYRRELNESMIQFKANPERGFEMLDYLMDGYVVAVNMGRIKT